MTSMQTNQNRGIMTKAQSEPLWYLATPYSKYPHGIAGAYELACKQSALLISHGIHVFSPIAHSHGIAFHGELDALSHDLWLKMDQTYMELCVGCIFLLAESWEKSFGMEQERLHFEKKFKPIVKMLPNLVPEYFLSYSPNTGAHPS